MSLGFAKEPFPEKSGASGTVVRNAEMKIVDPDTGDSLSRNQPGEICIRGDQIMKGYLNNPAATLETIDKDGWLHTGDIGVINDDDELCILKRTFFSIFVRSLNARGLDFVLTETTYL